MVEIIPFLNSLVKTISLTHRSRWYLTTFIFWPYINPTGSFEHLISKSSMMPKWHHPAISSGDVKVSRTPKTFLVHATSLLFWWWIRLFNTSWYHRVQETEARTMTCWLTDLLIVFHLIKEETVRRAKPITLQVLLFSTYYNIWPLVVRFCSVE